MRLCVQRVTAGSVRVDGEPVGEIGHGLVILLGIGADDDEQVADRLAAKVANLRIFSDENGKFDRSLLAVGGGLMLPLASIIHPDRHRIASWVGRWLLLLALSTGCAAIAIPWIIGGSTGSNLAEIASWHLTVRLLPPAALAGIVGFGLASAGVLFKDREAASLVSDVGCAAGLGRFDEELSVHDPASSSQTELAHRGLVDVDHPLTNI